MSLLLPRPSQALFPAIVFLAALAFARAEEGPPVRIFAAKGIAGALQEIGAVFTRKTGTPVSVISGGSLALSRQILRGASADLFVPEGAGVLVPLLRVGMVNEQSSHFLATDRLVVVAPASRAVPLDSPEAMAGESVRLLSIADPDVIPAGIQARRSLMALALWERVRDRVRISPDVKTALASVESGEADLGIVYLTDASGGKVRVVLTLPESSHEPIRYIAAVVAHPGASTAARPFLEFLLGPEARKILSASGLTPASP